jgi:cathepsin X
MRCLLVLCFLVVVAAKYQSEFVNLPGHTVKTNYRLPLPHEYTTPSDLPESFNWANVNGTSFVTKSLNQHLPHYCGSCWAHGALSALGDRIKIARGGKGVDINLAIQFILNCGTEVAGSCHGGSASGTYEFIKETGFVPYDTCLQYAACSQESSEGNCKSADYTCKKINTCRTCSTFVSSGGKCSEIDIFPNATIAEYGDLPSDVHSIKSEIFRRGPIPCGVNAEPVLEYTGGVFNDPSADRGINHIVSIIGWGVQNGTEYWIVRNSWGEYWGEMGYFRIATGSNQLGIEEMCSWATVRSFTEMNYPCYEDGSNCVFTHQVVDPAIKQAAVAARRLVSSASLQPHA